MLLVQQPPHMTTPTLVAWLPRCMTYGFSSCNEASRDGDDVRVRSAVIHAYAKAVNSLQESRLIMPRTIGLVVGSPIARIWIQWIRRDQKRDRDIAQPWARCQGDC